MGPENSRIPATLATDSWKPTDRSTKGLHSSIRRQAKDRLVRESYSRLTAPLRAIRKHIRQARVTEGEKPVIAPKKKSTGVDTRSSSHRLVLVNKYTMEKRMERCSPDTATIWRMPLSFKAVS